MRAWPLLALALLLAPSVLAAPPTPASWPAYAAPAPVRDVAISADGRTIAAALDRSTPSASSSGIREDLLIFDSETGFAKNGTQPGTVGSGSIGPVGGGGVAAQGRNFTAVSGDGATVVSVGLDQTQVNVGGGIDQPARVRLFFNRLAGAQRWAPDAPEVNGSVVLDAGVPAALVVSQDGGRVALAVQEATGFVVRGFALGSTFSSQFTYRSGGNVSDLVATPDLATLAVAGRVPEGNDTFAALHILPFTSGSSPAASYYDRTLNGSTFTSVALARDGSRVVAGDARGQLHVATGASMAQPLALPVNGAPVTRLLLADDGSRIAAVAGNALLMLDGTTAPPALLYNAATAGPVMDAAANRTLGLVVLAVNGTGAVAYGDLSSTPLWTVPGIVERVGVSADGNTVAYATRAAVAAVRVPHAIALEHAAGGDSRPAQPVRPQGTTTFPLVVRNSGAAVERVAFEFQRELDLTLVADPPVVAVGPDQTARVNVTVTTGPLFAGTRSFNVTAVALTSSQRDDATLTLQLRDDPDVRFLVNDTGDVAMKPGESRIVVLGVFNAGASDVAVGIRATQTVTRGAPWDVTVDPASLTLAPNSVTTVKVTVHAPADAADGTSNALRFALEGANVSDEVSLTFRINPTLGVEVNAVGRVKFVEPGAVAYYNVTVTNTGSLPRRFEAFYDATPQGGKTWPVDMDTGAFLLQPGATQTIPLRVFAPQDAIPNVDRVSVLVRARSFPEQLNETLAEGNVTLFANAVEPQATTTTTPQGNVIPAPATPLLLIGLATLALLHRRRRP